MTPYRVLHIFSEFLPLTMSWAYLLLKHTPSVQPYIAALRLLENNYTDPNFIFWPNPRYSKWIASLNRLFPFPVHVFFRKSKRYDDSMYRYCRKHDIQLIHAHFGNIGADYFPLGQRLNIPVVVSFYGFDYGRILHAKPRYRTAYQKMFDRVDAIICEGPYGGQQLKKLGCPAEKIHLIHLGVEVDRIPFWERKKMPGSLRMVQVASFEDRKGQTDAVKAVALALKDCPNLSLDLIGPPFDPVIVQEVEQSIEHYQLNGKVRIKPPVSYDRLHEALRAYDLMLQPSRHTDKGDCEGGAPIILLDAQATGLPVVATRHCDIPEEVLHGQTGRLAGERQAQELADHIKSFYTMGQDEYRQYARAARRHIEEQYAAEPCSRQVSDLYHQLIADKV